ncbi:MAG: glycosyltransferase family 9 protein, partial [Deltaproteobacteria bacterium]|nr:glycosyltransferase family 9 protein [Deltaproteobacteria bacterium]
MTKNFVDIRKLVDRYIGMPLLVFIRILSCFSKPPETQSLRNLKVKNILAIYLSGIGDTVMVASCLKQIARHYPNAAISFLASSQNHEIVRQNPYLLQRLHLNTTKGFLAFVHSLTQLMREIRRQQYDLIIDFEQF